MEMAVLRDAHVGYPGISGLSVEQRKRLTIGVELVANPSIIFMDVRHLTSSARLAALACFCDNPCCYSGSLRKTFSTTVI